MLKENITKQLTNFLLTIPLDSMLADDPSGEEQQEVIVFLYRHFMTEILDPDIIVIPAIFRLYILKQIVRHISIRRICGG